MNCNNISRISIVTIGYILCVSLYFCRSLFDIDSRLWLDVTKVLPVSFLFVVSWLSGGNKLLPIALLLSAIGDFAGEEHHFIWQIAMFAMAHIAFICYFVRRAHIDKLAKILIPLWVVILIPLGVYVLVNIGSLTMMVACSVYMLLIGSMAAATMAIKSPYRWWYIVAALIFVLSDYCIAWNKFVEHFSYAGVVIMSTYFAAQFILSLLYQIDSNLSK